MKSYVWIAISAAFLGCGPTVTTFPSPAEDAGSEPPPEDPVCPGCWDGKACHPNLSPEPDPCLVHACGLQLRCDVVVSCGDCGADEVCADGIPGKACVEFVTSCAEAANGTPCSESPVTLGHCLGGVCRCGDASACTIPLGCKSASCDFGSCAFKPVGCAKDSAP